MADIQAFRLADAARFTLGALVVTPAARTLRVGSRETLIEPRVMQVLVVLHRRNGEVVGREELIDVCWEGRAVGEDAVNRAILKLRRALDEIESGVKVETIARVGYRLHADDGPSDHSAVAQPQRGKSRRRWLAGAIVAASLAVVAVLLMSRHDASLISRIIVVQPLRAAQNDAPARQLAQDFASDLSRAVIGHDGRLEFADAQDITKKNAAFTVSGTVASVGRNMQAVVMVTKPDDPAILWSHDYTAPFDDADGLRQQVGTNVAAVLVCALGTEGVPDQIDEATTALYLETCSLHAGDHQRESDLLRQVVARAPRFAGAWADLAISLAFVSDDTEGEDAAALRRESRAAALHALGLDPHIGRAYFAQAMLLPGIDNWMARERLIDAGLRAQPDCAPLYNVKASDMAAIGRQQDSIDSNRRAVALDPLFPGKWATLARALSTAGDLAGATAVVRRMQETWPGNDFTWHAQFETAARLGDPREAEAMLDHPPQDADFKSKIAGWKTFLKAREAPTTRNVQDSIAALMKERRLGEVTDVQLVSNLTLLGRPDMALQVALETPPQAETDFWFRSFLQPLHADPRFMVIAQRQGLYPIWRATGLWPDFCNDRKLRYNCRTELPARRLLGQRTNLSSAHRS